MKILVHICCSIDSHYYLYRLKNEYPDATILGYFCDPNIHPIEEYELRYIDVARSCNKLNIKLYKAPYEDINWLKKCSPLAHEPERGKRCDLCFDFRLQRSAQAAIILGANYLATTLSCSPKKDLEQLEASANRIILNLKKAGINEIFEKEFLDDLKSIRLSEEIWLKNLKFLNPDYRKNGGTQEQLLRAKIDNLYHQNYCGCAFALIASRKDALISELFSSASAEVLPNSCAQRLQVFKRAYELEQNGLQINITKRKILNYRLLSALIVQNKVPIAAAVLFYSHFSSKRAAINLDALIKAKAESLGYDKTSGYLEYLRAKASEFKGDLSEHPLLLRAHKDDICIAEFSVLDGILKDYNASKWIKKAPPISEQIKIRKMLCKTCEIGFDISPIIFIDKLGGKLEISAKSEIYPDILLSCKEL